MCPPRWLSLDATVNEKEDRRVWRPHRFGSTLFLVASTFGILASGAFLSVQSHSYLWRIAWRYMVGSILFMASAVAAYVLPSPGDPVSVRISVAGTLLGAVCFLFVPCCCFLRGEQP